MTAIDQLRYVRLGTRNLPAATNFAQRILGLQLVEQSDCAHRKVRALASFRDPGGNTFELVLRPLNSGWRYFPSRDAGITGLSGVALRAPDVSACEELWTTVFNGRVSDWHYDGVQQNPGPVSNAVYLDYGPQSYHASLAGLFFRYSF